MVFVHMAINCTLFSSLVLALLEQVILKMLSWQLLSPKSSSFIHRKFGSKLVNKSIYLCTG